MSTIDYSKYSINSLLDVKKHIDKVASPKNYDALMKEFKTRNFNIEEHNKNHVAIELKSAEVIFKIIGVFQLFAALIFIPYLLFLELRGYSLNANIYIIAIIFVAFNAISGWTAFKGIKKYYWLSILNQSLQLFNFSAGSFIIKYSSIGGIYTIIKWGNDSGLSFSAEVNPGFYFLLHNQLLPNGYIAIDIIAIIFITALVSAYNKSNS